MGKPILLIPCSLVAALTLFSACFEESPSTEESSTGGTDASSGPAQSTTTGATVTTEGSDGSSSTGNASSTSGLGETETSTGQDPTPIDLENLQDWTRVEGRLIHDVVDGYGVAADIHVFQDEDGELAAIYSGTDASAPDYASIKLALGTEHTSWEVGPVVLNRVDAPPEQRSKETSFYRRGADGTHQIYYIGYEDEETYRSQIFRAESANLEGPYTIDAEPIIARGLQGEHDIQVMTSPSIVEHDGTLYMVYCAWNQFEGDGDDLQVWVHAATSTDDGDTWTVLGEVDVPVCMEGAITQGPDGMFYAVSQQSEAIVLGRSDEPLGDWEMLPEPILSPAGPPYEVDITTPQLYFQDDVLFLYYSGANFTDVDYEPGWWTMLAYTSLE